MNFGKGYHYKNLQFILIAAKIVTTKRYKQPDNVNYRVASLLEGTFYLRNLKVKIRYFRTLNTTEPNEDLDDILKILYSLHCQDIQNVDTEIDKQKKIIMKQQLFSVVYILHKINLFPMLQFFLFFAPFSYFQQGVEENGKLVLISRNLYIPLLRKHIFYFLPPPPLPLAGSILQNII